MFAIVKQNVGSRETSGVALLCRRAVRVRIVAALASLLVGITGATCDPSAIRVRSRPPEPRLVDEGGDVDVNAFDALVTAVEQQRGLGFIQQPRLEVLAADDPRLPGLQADARALEPCPTEALAEASPEPVDASCFADASFAFALCLTPPDLDAARRVLRRLLDAQNYPRLVRAAPLLRGDPGVAIRAVLAASATGAATGVNTFAGDGGGFDLLDLPQIEVERRATPGEGCVELASSFLASQSDREAPFRTPPLSTKVLASPKAYRASERPTLLLGTPPDVAGCELASDESLGVARILVGMLAKGGAIPGPALAGWQGDRGLRFTCASADAPWIYVVELVDAAHAVSFAAAVPPWLQDAFPGRSETQRSGRRVVIAHGFDAARARTWAASLGTAELVRFDGLE